jgi:hypothetical protein
MSEANPYEAPAPPSSALAMRLALRLLELRQAEFTLGRYYRWQFKGYLALGFAFGVGIAYFSWLGLTPMATALVGALVGVLLRDLGIARVQKKVWPVQKKLLDWGQVERMAAGEDL